MLSGENVLIFEEKLKRIVETANEGPPDHLSSSLVHAYAGCLSIDEFATAITTTWHEKTIVRRAILKKATAMASGSDDRIAMDKIGMHILAACNGDRKARIYFDSALARLYSHFSPSFRMILLDAWLDRGTASAGYRWLKAIKSDELLFSYDAVRRYWLNTMNPNAAAVLASRCEPKNLECLLSELLDKCDKGWIISRAAVRINTLKEEHWKMIEEKYPSTYVYLCAKKGIIIDEEKAMTLFRSELNISIFGQEGGLMIWSFGQLRMWGVLDRIRAILPEERHIAAENIRRQYNIDVEEE